MAEINESKDGTLYGCPECEKVCNAAEKNICQRNKMAEVAALFGKKLDEVFLVELKDEYSARCFQRRIWRVKLTPAGLKCFIPNEGWFINRPILSDLLTAGAVIIDG